ncbi:hypothetical protein HOY80DRAFT_10219 [Tuber brumale]|nr:hypothetical protein HOY80DRAFT_10219 [Tuber brumale]
MITATQSPAPTYPSTFPHLPCNFTLLPPLSPCPYNTTAISPQKRPEINHETTHTQSHMPPPPDLLQAVTTITTSLTTTSTSLQSPEFPSLPTPENSISLLDLENELLFSYIHNAVFFLLVRLLSGTLSNVVNTDATKELVKIRVMLERKVVGEELEKDR